jgi:hypothetical protein
VILKVEKRRYRVVFQCRIRWRADAGLTLIVMIADFLMSQSVKRRFGSLIALAEILGGNEMSNNKTRPAHCARITLKP